MKLPHNLFMSSVVALPMLGLLSQNTPAAQCMSPEDEAALMQRIMHEEGGNIDPEEMQAIMRRARGEKRRTPPQFMRLMMPLKGLTMVQPINGLRVEVGIPFSPKFQSQLSWVYNNKDQAQFEYMSVLVNGNGMMDDDMSMCQCMGSTAGRQQVVIQKSLGNGLKLNLENDLSESPDQCGLGISLNKDMPTANLNYMIQLGGGQGAVHLLSYMQAISQRMTAGWSAVYLVSSFIP